MINGLRNESKNWSSIKVRVGMVETQVLGDELDSATVILTLEDKLDIEPYDLISLNYNNKTSYWLCADFVKTFVKKTSPQKYDYTINLMSLTKLLETVILPSMSITAHPNKNDRTIADYIKRTYRRYFSDIANKYGCSVGVNISEDFDNECPECTFSQPTLREYLDYLMQFKGCIAQLVYQNGLLVLQAFNLNQTNGVFDIDFVDNLSSSQGANDYVTELVAESNEIVSNTYIRETLGTKNESGIYTSENANIVLTHKPYDIEYVTIKQLSNTAHTYSLNGLGINVYTYNGSEYMLSDIANNPDVYVFTGNGGTMFNDNTIHLYMGDNITIDEHLVTQEVFNGLENIKGGTYFQMQYLCNSKRYKNNTIVWNRGSQTITNLNYYETSAGFVRYNDNPSIEMAMLNKYFSSFIDVSGRNHDGVGGFPNGTFMYPNPIVINNVNYYLIFNTNNVTIDSSDTAYKYDEALFEIRYKPYVDFKITQKQDNYTHLVSQANNSTNSLTDIKSFYAQCKEKNNQLGNETITFTGYSSITQDKFKLGQIYVVDGDGTYILNRVEKTMQVNSIQYKGTLTKNFSNRELQTILNREKRYYSLPTSASVTRKEIGYFENENLNSETLRYAVFVDGDFKCSIPAIRTILDDNTLAATFNPFDNAVVVNFVDDVDVYGIKDAKAINFYQYCDIWGETYNLKLVLWNGLYTDNFRAEPFGETLEINLNNNFLKDSREKIVFTAIIKHN